MLLAVFFCAKAVKTCKNKLLKNVFYNLQKNGKKTIDKCKMLGYNDILSK